jgi:hypothetical protein
VSGFPKTAAALEHYDERVLVLLARLSDAAEREDFSVVGDLTQQIEELALSVTLAFFEDTTEFNTWETVKQLRPSPKTVKEPSFIRKCVAGWKAAEAAKC